MSIAVRARRSLTERIWFTKILLKPSLLSGIVVLLLAFTVLLLPSLTFLQGNEELFDIFYSEYGVITALQTTSNGFTTIKESLLAASWTYNLVIFIISVAIGLIVYLATKLLNRILYGISTPLLLMRGANWNPAVLFERVYIARFVVRVMGLVLWIVYCFFTFKVILPFCVLAISNGLDMFPSWQGVWYGFVLGFGFFTGALHLHVVFLRIVALRLRLLGDPDEIYA